MRPINLQVRARTGHEAPITGVSLRDDGIIATSSYDGTVMVWDDDLQPTRMFAHRRLVNSVAWNPVQTNLLASASADKTVAIWNVDLGDSGPVCVMSRHTDDVNSVKWFPDGQRIACVSEDGHVSVWDALTASLVATLPAHRAHCMAVAVSRTGRVASVGEDGMVQLSLIDGSVVTAGAAKRFDSSIEGCEWSADGRFLALALDAGRVVVVDEVLDEVSDYEVSSSAVRSVGWLNDDRGLFAGTYDGSVYAIDHSGGGVSRLDSEVAWPRSIACSNSRLVVGSFSSRPQVYSLSGGKAVISDDRGVGLRSPNAICKTGARVAVGTDSGEVVFLRQVDLREVRVVKVGDSPVLGLSGGASGAVVGSTYAGTVFRLAGDEVTTSQQFGAPIPSISEAAGTIWAGTYGGEILEINPEQLSLISRTTLHDGSIKALTHVRGGSVLTAATDKRVSISGPPFTERVDLWSHGNLVNAVSELDNGAFIASASRDRTVVVASLAPNGQVAKKWTLMGPDESIKSVVLLRVADQLAVVAGGYDFGLYYWVVDPASSGCYDLQAGAKFAEFDQAISCMTRLSDTEFVVAGWDRKICRYVFEDGRPVLAARTTLGHEW